MGGNALKVPTRRYDKEEYEKISLDVLTILNKSGIVATIPQSYFKKETFGDLDVIIKSSTIKGEIINIINEQFNPNEIYNNNNVKSFDYREFQIDFILVSDENWVTSINYFSFNDLGNFLGRISYHMGFRFGDYGLKLAYRHKDGGRIFSKIISKEPSKIYEFLGLNYSEYLKGFDDLEDIFKYVIGSKYFNSKIFDYEELNHRNRTRNKKRKNYTLFLEYIKNNPKGNKMTIGNYENDKSIETFLETTYIYADRDSYITMAEKFFNIDIFKEINKWNEIIDQEKRASDIFNGNVVMEHFQLRGKELGNAMKKFNNHFNSFIPNASMGEQKLYRSRWILNNNINNIIDLFSKLNKLN